MYRYLQTKSGKYPWVTNVVLRKFFYLQCVIRRGFGSDYHLFDYCVNQANSTLSP